MKTHNILRHGALGTAMAAALALALAAAPATPAAAAGAGSVSTASGRVMTLSKGRGQLITLSRPMSDLFVADPTIADVQVRSPTKLYIFGKGPGETTVSATAQNGAVVFAATVRVGNNISDVSQMLRVTMPDAHITATPMNGLMLLTGTVASPDDIEEASRLVSAYVGKDVQVISRLKAATPLQVMLRVRFAEVNRDLSKTIGFNILTQDNTGGFKFGISEGSGLSFNPAQFTHSGAGSTLGFAGHLLGLDIISALDLAETNGYATTLAQPTLVALSGETASFLAGGEIPIPVPQYQGVTTIEYKQYGVSLAFTPTVLGDGRISLRVRPEVSQLTSSTVQIAGYTIPGLTTRRAETTVELGSGQSFVIGGLLSNNTNNTVDKTPVLGDLPIIGQLFRSNSWKRSESELVIVVTPYLVKPVSDRQIALPTDGYRAPTDAQRFALDMAMDSRSGTTRAKPQAAPPVTQSGPAAVLPADTRRRDEAPAAPGISYK